MNPIKPKFLLAVLVVALTFQAQAQSSGRFSRGTGSDPTYQSFVIPLDGEMGVSNAPSLASTIPVAFPPVNAPLYHVNFTNSAYSILISNAIVAFGSQYGGSALYVGQDYHFGAYAGNPTLTNGWENSAFVITAVNRTNGTITSYGFTVPAVYNTTVWSNFIQGGTMTNLVLPVAVPGLTTTYALSSQQGYGDDNVAGDLVLTHKADTNALGYEYTIWVRGFADSVNPMVLGTFSTNTYVEWSPLYTLDFSQRPATQSTFVSQPQFTGQPIPPIYEGKSLTELQSVKAVVTNAVAGAATNYLDVDNSPELRQHPILDQFVADMGSNAMALASYVQNKIQLTDAIAYNSNTNVSDTSINLGGVNRGALGVYLEGQGSPVEQCALLIYLLRRCGVPAAYIYGPPDGVQMLDSSLSQLLQMQIHGAVNRFGTQYTTNTLIGVNYPWVAAYIGGQWVHLFPWLKNTEVIEGLNLYDYMPTNYTSGNQWLRQYLHLDPNIFSLNTNSDVPSVLFPAFIENALLTTDPNVSIDDLGDTIVNRSVQYSRWSDFPTPFAVTNGTVNTVHDLTSITNIFPTWTNIFDTISVQLFSTGATNKSIFTGDLRTADLHNRKFLLRHQTNGTGYTVYLSLAPYRTNATNLLAFTNDASLLNQETLSTNLTTNTDNALTIQFIRKSHRTFPVNGVANPYLGVEETQIVTNALPVGLGDLSTICINSGQVSKQMLAIWAQEYWNMQQEVAVNPSITNTLSPDITQGTLPYLMGMSYYERIGRFGQQLAGLHKVHIGTYVSIGLSTIAAKRNTNGTLFSPLTINHPKVDMHGIQIGLSANGTLRPDEGAAYLTATDDWFRLFLLEGSAQEHQCINDFYGNNGSISTVRLLFQAQQAGQPGMLELNIGNYLNYTNLASYDAGTWQQITNAFHALVNSNETDVFVTQKPITNLTASFQGMGAMIYGGGIYAALISANQLPQNGGYGEEIPPSEPIYNPPDYNNNTLTFSTDDNSGPSVTYEDPTVSAPEPLASAPPILNAATTYTDLSTGATPVDDSTQVAAYNQAALILSLTSGTTTTDASVYENTVNGGSGYDSSVGQDHAQSGSVLLDPVNSVTGEFYVDATDLVMPGPMPLIIRRNYSSQNLDLGDLPFGSGWRIGFQPYLRVITNNLICGTEMDGTVVEYRQLTGTNIWKPTVADNPQLNNHSSIGTGSIANPFNNLLTNQVVGSVTNFYLTGADGSLRTFQYTNYPIPGTTNTFTRNRPYLQTWRDASGNRYSFAYQTNNTLPDYGLLHRVQSANGDFVIFYYDTSGHVIELLTGDGREFDYQYDAYGDLTTVTFPDDSQINYVYQHSSVVTNSVTNIYSTHLITQEQKPNGRVVANTYDSLRRVIFQASTVGSNLNLVTNGTFIYSNNVTSLTNSIITGTTYIKDVFGHTNIYQYANNLITNIVDPLGHTVSQTWYSNTNDAGYYPQSLKLTVDKRGLTNSFQYDTFGNLTNNTASGDLTGNGVTSNAVTSATYNTYNLPVLIIDPIGNRQQFVYSTNYLFLPQQLIRLAGTTPVVTNFFVYTNATNVVISGAASITNTAYGLLTRKIRAYGTPDAATNDLFYSGQGFITNSIQYTGTGDPAISNTFFYNELGELVQKADAAGRFTTFDYDPMGRPAGRETYETGQSVPMDWNYSYYNENGELTWTEGARYNPQDYVWRDYDGAGRKTQEIHWCSQANANGSGVSAATGNNLYATSFYQYDSLDNLIQATDPLGNYVMQGYDFLGQLTQQTFYGSNGVALATNYYAHEPGGLVSAITNALGGVTTKLYTSTGKLKFQQNPNGSTQSWNFDLTGRVVKETLANGNYRQTLYSDSLNRITNFFNNATAALSTNITQLDLRGNVKQSIDAYGNTWTNLYDGLDRIKIAAGPAATNVMNVGLIPGTNFVTNVFQQLTTYIYDNCGKVLTVSNVLGETTVTTSDAIGRPIQVAVYNSDGVTLAHVVNTFYSADHNSVTVTNGSGANAIITTTYTDTAGRPLLSIGYPTNGITEFSWWQYDPAGNCIAQQQCSSNASGITVWATNGWTYDGLNRVATETTKDGATTTYSRDALGDVTNRAMPRGLTWSASYLNDGRIASEQESGGGVTVRSMSYNYYGTNSSFVGRLQTVTDGRSTTRTNTYDDFMRLAEVNSTGSAGQQQTSTSYQYDLRNLLTSLSQSFNSTNTGPSTSVTRAYDAYGHILAESVSIAGASVSTMGQTWDGAGRRSQLNGVPFNYQADGLMIASDGSVYSYANNGLLTGRINANRAYSVTQRDGRGRVLQTSTTVGIATALTETLSWRNDGRLTNYVAARGDFTDTRNYAYSPLANRLAQESFNVGSGQKLTNNYTTDNGASAGLGILTSKAESGTASASWTVPSSGGLDGVSRVAESQNTLINRPAYGLAQGAGTVTATLDGNPVSIQFDGSTGSGQWRANLDMSSGSHTLAVSAVDPSGLYSGSSNSTFTVASGAVDTVTNVYDGNGNVTQRVWINNLGVTNRIQNLTWDAFDRLVQVADRDTNNSGFNFVSIFDGFGRRIRTIETLVTNSVPIVSPASSISTVDSWYDPQVEFLETAVNLNGVVTLKTFGPDANGVYGGMQGVGGLESIYRPDHFNAIGSVQDYFGNVIGTISSNTVAWNPDRFSSYGPVPGYQAQSLSLDTTLALTPGWRGKRADPTGNYYFGARSEYDPVAGRFTSADPLGHGASMDLYSFCGGDPVNTFDPDGRISKELYGQGPFVLPYLSDSDFVLRYENPANVSSVFQQGYPANGNLSPSDVAFNTWSAEQEIILNNETLGLSGRSWYPASTLPGGATTLDGPFDGIPLYIDLNQAGKVATSDQIVASAQQSGISASRIQTYQNNNPNEGEVLVGDVPPGAVLSQSAYVANGLAQAGTALGVALTAGRMIQAGEQSYQTGDSSYVVNQGVREAGGWAGAWAGAQATGGVIAAGGWETGPAYPFLIIGGSIAGGIAGYNGANLLTQSAGPVFNPTSDPRFGMGGYAPQRPLPFQINDNVGNFQFVHP